MGIMVIGMKQSVETEGQNSVAIEVQIESLNSVVVEIPTEIPTEIPIVVAVEYPTVVMVDDRLIQLPNLPVAESRPHPIPLDLP